MIEKKDWKEFKESGLLWFMNTILHMFGWAIVLQQNENGNIEKAYPARVKFRGFSEERNDEGYKQVSRFMKEHADELLKETEE